MDIKNIAPGTPESINVIVEIPKLSRIKYEIDEVTGLIAFDRVLYSPMHYPANYGFVPQTLWDDGDPLDVLVLGHEPLVPGCLVRARPIGVLDMNDSGQDDAKVLAVPEKDPRFNAFHDIGDVEPHLLDELRHFFETYKQLQKKEVRVGAWRNRAAALSAIQKAIGAYRK